MRGVTEMSESAYQFVLVGTRFTRLLVDESSIGAPEEGEFEARINRRIPVVSEHKYNERPVIEVAVSIEIKDTSNDKVIVHIECTGGFIGASTDLDGNLDAFKECREFFARALFWIVRSRLQTLSASTRINTAPLPWDYDKGEQNTEFNKARPRLGKTSGQGAKRATSKPEAQKGAKKPKSK